MNNPITRSRVSTPVWGVSLTLIMFHAYIGLGYALAPVTSQRPVVYEYVLDTAPLGTWGMMFLIGIPFLLLAAVWQNRPGAMASAMAAAPMLVFSVLVFAAELDGTSDRFGSAAVFVPGLVLHAIMARHSWKRGC